MIEKIFEILKKGKNIKSEDLKNIVIKDNNLLLSRQLSDIINGIISSNSEYILKGDSIKINHNGLNFYITVNVSEKGLIHRLKITPIVPKIRSMNELKNVLSNLSLNYGIFSTGFYDYSYRSNEKFAVSSLVKIVIADVIYKMINDGFLNLFDVYEIRKDDLSYLSAGISISDVGSSITIKELISRLLLASDNTAMDILLKLINEEYKKEFMCYLADEDIRILPTKKIYKKSWGIDLNNQNKKEEYILNNTVWIHGLDYFISLEYVSKCLDYLMHQNWLPWDDINNRQLIFKGGSSTGVLSSIWMKNDCFNSKFAFVINNKEPINVLDNIYIYECINMFLRFNNFL